MLWTKEGGQRERSIRVRESEETCEQEFLYNEFQFVYGYQITVSIILIFSVIVFCTYIVMNHYNFIIINSSLVLLLLYRFLTGNFGKPLSLFFLVIVTVIIITLTPSSVSDEARRSLMGRVKVGFGTLSDHPVVTRLGLKRSLPQDHVRRGSQ